MIQDDPTTNTINIVVKKKTAWTNVYLNYSRRKKEIIKGKEKVLVFSPKEMMCIQNTQGNQKNEKITDEFSQVAVYKINP